MFKNWDLGVGKELKTWQQEYTRKYWTLPKLKSFALWKILLKQ